MKAIVIGGGIVGIATALALADEGMKVTLLEREVSLGLGTSYANAGQLSPTMAAPWAVPGLLSKAAGWLVQKHPPLRLSKFDPSIAAWLWRMFRASNEEQFMAAKRAMVELSMYSRSIMHGLADRGLAFGRGGDGTLVLLRNPKMAKAFRADTEVLDRMNLPYAWMTGDDVRAREPNISRTADIHAGVLLMADETGDCHEATQSFGRLALTAGVEISYRTEVSGLTAEKGRIRTVRTSKGDLEADLVVLSSGVWSGALLRPFGLAAPVIPLKGYSLTIAADPEAQGPVSTISDDYFKVGITNLGDRIRVGGTAELAGYDLSRPEARFAPLEHVVRDLFPGVSEADVAVAQRWSGLRPTTPDGPPIICRTPGFANLILNFGHGTLGWTMAAGSAALVAAMAANRATDLDVAPFSIDRFR